MNKTTYGVSDKLHKTDPSVLYLDIETTGLARDTTILYLLGLGYYEGNILHIIQWFNDDAVSEPQILQAFQDFLAQKHWTICTFNGDSFDLPYLKRHFALHAIPCLLDKHPSRDLFRLLRPFQKRFGLKQGRQKDWEDFMNFHREDRYNGRELIRIYKDFLHRKGEEQSRLLFLHNLEDIYYMAQLSPLLAYPSMMEGHFSYEGVSMGPQSFEFCETSLQFHCKLDLPVPKAMDIHRTFGSVHTDRQMLTMDIPAVTGTMKYYYKDYQNYYYLPGEDRAVHKSIGQYVDRKHRTKCNAANCYTRKEGVFLPSSGNVPTKELTLYRPDFHSKEHFFDFDELFSRENNIITDYLTNYMRKIFT